MAEYELFGTAGCHLCEEAEELLRRALAGKDFERVDIALDPELSERYGIRIPVILDRESGAELGWPFDAGGLAEFLRGRVI